MTQSQYHPKNITGESKYIKARVAAIERKELVVTTEAVIPSKQQLFSMSDELDTQITSDVSTSNPSMNIMDAWSRLNEADIDEDLSVMPMKDLVERNVNILEKHILQVMITRDKEISEALATNPDYITSPATENCPLELDILAKQELVDYVSTIGSMYKMVLYHNFEHASHVLGSADALISMIKVESEQQDLRSSFSTVSSSISDGIGDASDEARKHVGNFGISSCPMTHLALVFSALIHDVEHQGVSNKQLVDENNPLAIKYDGKSVAEYNSLDVGRMLLEQEKYPNLRRCMFGDASNLPPEAAKVVNSNVTLFQDILLATIQATDISSKDRLERISEKWIEAFEKKKPNFHCSCGSTATSAPSAPPAPIGKGKRPSRRSSLHTPASFQQREARSMSSNDVFSMEKCEFCSEQDYSQLDYLKASTVLEQMIQAADVAHSMQSWEVFMKWNTKLYDELWAAKLKGRGPDVSANWFKGQMGFFDHYILPLAKRLEQSGVFGKSGEIFAKNLEKNRTRWLEEGEDRCKDMHNRVLKLQGDGEKR